jgi:hypothetical protein
LHLLEHSFIQNYLQKYLLKHHKIFYVATSEHS